MIFSELLVKSGCICSIPVWSTGSPFLWQEKWVFGLKRLPSQLTQASAPARSWVQKHCCGAEGWKDIDSRVFMTRYKAAKSCCRGRAGSPPPPACHRAQFCCCQWEQMIPNCDHTSHSRINQSMEVGFPAQRWSGVEELVYAAAHLHCWGNEIYSCR